MINFKPQYPLKGTKNRQRVQLKLNSTFNKRKYSLTKKLLPLHVLETANRKYVSPEANALTMAQLEEMGKNQVVPEGQLKATRVRELLEKMNKEMQGLI